jgi:uncharacterized protein YcaQ
VIAPTAVAELSLSQARRVALRAQGLDRPRPEAPVTGRRFVATADRLGLLQIDSVNVLARAHLVPAFSRLGPYDPALLERAAGRAPRRLVETWAHEASYVPVTTYPLLAWRRRAWRDRLWAGDGGFVHTHAAELDEVRALVRDTGPVTAREVHAVFADRHPRAGRGWWDWTVAKEALERLFLVGEVASAGRTPSFERRYDLVERVLPAAVLAAGEPPDAEAVRTLLATAARAHGIGTARCFADYFRIRGPQVAPAVDELIEDGVLQPVRVRGWNRTTYLHRDALVPRRATGRALLSPFDPVVFERRRLEELFATRYRIEIYTPAAQRVHGYYVLPFLLGEQVAARVDLKADRQQRTLLVQAAHLEPHAPRAEVVVAELAAELALMARWLGLEDVLLSEQAHGALVAPLGPALASVIQGGAG